jgi:hypothetical protein
MTFEDKPKNVFEINPEELVQQLDLGQLNGSEKKVGEAWATNENLVVDKPKEWEWPAQKDASDVSLESREWTYDVSQQSIQDLPPGAFRHVLSLYLLTIHTPSRNGEGTQGKRAS